MTKEPFTDEDGEVRELTAEEIRGMKPLAGAYPEMLETLKRPGRPISENPKEKVTIRLDPDIVEWLRSNKGYNAMINDALREMMEEKR